MALKVNLPLPEGTRRPTGPDDFGDTATIGLHLKKREAEEDDPHQYGIYLGCDNGTGKWVVGLKNLMTWKIEDVAEYDSIAELKGTWRLD